MDSNVSKHEQIDVVSKVRCWRNLRYGQAPMGPRRFAPPQMHGLSDEDFQQGLMPQIAIVAPQRPSRLERVTGPLHGETSEDCLRLNVWAREDVAQAQLPAQPVLVWLHGGAWLSGAGTADWYDGSRWAQESAVVVVGVNYRLGALGWLVGDDAQHSNLGLQDIALALRWIQEHIGRFGGDASRMTVMGQSAGGENIAALLQGSQPVPFHQVIVQSAPLGEPVRRWEDAQRIRSLVWRNWSVRSWDEARALPLEQVLAGQLTPAVADLAADSSPLGLVYRVVADELHVPYCEQAEFIARAAARLPSVVGATNEEISAFPGRSLSGEDLELGREIFNAPASYWQRQAHEQGQKSWRYAFGAQPNPEFGACHCVDLPFTFGSFAAFAHAPMLAGADVPLMERSAHAWRAALQSFVCQGHPGWPVRSDVAQPFGQPECQSTSKTRG